MNTQYLDDLPAAAEGISADTERWPAQMAELADFAADELLRCGLDRSTARRYGCRVAARLCQEFGGARYYWPRADALARAVRDMQIWAEHDGTRDGPNGISAIARRYKLTDNQIWAILRAQRLMHRAR